MANTPQQFLKINIRTSGHIFQGRSAFECARILESIAAELREHPNDTGREFDVYNARIDMRRYNGRKDAGGYAAKYASKNNGPDNWDILLPNQ